MLAESRQQLAVDIDSWVEQEVEIDHSMVPDFWDELSTSDRLADYLWTLGYRKVDTENEM